MFEMIPVECKPVTSQGLIDMAVCNNIICIALGNMHILRLNLAEPGILTTIPVTQHQQNEQIHKIFLDPTGTHLIISMSTANNWYLHGSWKKKLIYLKDMKGIVVNSVAWDRLNTDPETTNTILIGSTTGSIFEFRIDIPQGQMAKCKPRQLNSIYNVGENMSITGLSYERFPHIPGEVNPKYLVIATTPTRFYQFIGGPDLARVPNSIINPGFRELLGDRADSVFRMYSPRPDVLPQSFAWLTGPGISHGKLHFETQQPGDSVSQEMELMVFTESMQKIGAPAVSCPVSLVITEFHWIVIYDNKIQAINQLNEEVVWKQVFRADQNLGHILGITKDPRTDTIWMYTSNQVFEVAVTDEDRDIWKLYLAKNRYDRALYYAKTSKQKDIVWSAQAEHLYEAGRYTDAATYFGKTSLSFEEVSLKFIRMNNRDALKTYLLQKLDNLTKTDVTQRTLLCTWLVEIYLDKLNRAASEKTSNVSLLKAEFKDFLAKHKESLNKQITYNLISSHGRVDELLYFAIQVGNFEMVISYHIQQKEWMEALKVLQLPYQKNEELYYNFLPVLMNQIPCETVNELLKVGSTLNARKLIPALMRYDSRKNTPGVTEHQSIRYLQYAIDVLGNDDPTVHNFLISLYANSTRYHDALLKFLSVDNPVYDREYALRTCAKEDQMEACIIIYSAMEEYEEAVELSLKIDIDLAKDQIQKVDDDERKKKLWLRIARHVVEKEENIKEAMAFLSQADNLLKIEDILPFFPEFTLIDDFKEEICNALKEYNERIEELKLEMDEATRSAVMIRRDIKNLRNKYGFVSQNQMCDICGYPVLTRMFYLFPCLHVYHGDCLIKEVGSHLSSEKRAHISYLETEIGKEAMNKKNSLMDTVRSNEVANVTALAEKESRQSELDDIVASECLLCGDIMIQSVTQPLFDTNDSSAGWEI